jgi:hypothetical protein
MKNRIIICALCISILMLTGYGIADIPVNQTPETMGFSTSTAVSGDLAVHSEVDSAVLQVSSYTLDGVLESGGQGLALGPYILVPHDPVSALVLGLLGEAGSGGEVQYTAAYGENTIGSNGLMSYTKVTDLDTGNRVVGGSNFESSKVMEFVGSDTGRLVSSEDMVVDGAGLWTLTSGAAICPFASDLTDAIPSFCNIVETGSDLDVTVASVATATESGFIAGSADVPTESDYGIRVTGFGDIPAMGSASAFINVHAQEGGAIKYLVTFPFLPADPQDQNEYYADLYSGAGKAGDLVYQESSSASGEITLFNKVMSYQSGIRRV